MDYAYQGKHPPTKLAAMAIVSNAYPTQDLPWLTNSVATDHVTSSLNHLNFPNPYHGQNLPITHLGNVFFPLPHSTLHLNNVLR